MSAKITAAMHQVMSAVGYVQKTGKNSFHNYRYAGEADLLEKLRPAMLDAGLLLLPSVEEVSPIDEHGIVTVRVAYTLAHKDGDVWPTPLYAAGSGGGKNSKGGVDDKGVYKAITGANKYLLFKLFQIETGDDPENDASEPQGRPQAASAHSPRNDTRAPIRPAPEAPTSVYQPSAGMTAQSEANRAIHWMQKNQTMKALDTWLASNDEKLKAFTEADRRTFQKAVDQHRASLLPLTAAG